MCAIVPADRRNHILGIGALTPPRNVELDAARARLHCRIFPINGDRESLLFATEPGRITGLGLLTEFDRRPALDRFYFAIEIGRINCVTEPCIAARLCEP